MAENSTPNARRAHYELVQTDNEQPWHIRLVGANGEIVLTSENYADPRDAAHAVEDALRAEPGYYRVDERKAPTS